MTDDRTPGAATADLSSLLPADVPSGGRLLPSAAATLLAALAASALSLLAGGDWLGLGLGLMSGVLAVVALLLSGLVVLRRLRDDAARAVAQALVEDEPLPVLVSDAGGRLLARNRAARAEGRWPISVAGALLPHLAAADPLVDRLLGAVRRTGQGAETVAGRRGQLRLSAHRAGEGFVVWRLDQPAVMDPADLPALHLDPSGLVLSCNEPFRRSFGQPPSSIDDLLLDPPLRSGRVHRVTTAAGPVELLALERLGVGGQRQLFLLPPPDRSSEGRPGSWTAVETLPVPLLRLSPSGLVLAANASARALLAHPLGEGTRLSDLLDGLGRPVAEWVADVAEGRPTTGPQFLRGTREQQDTVVRVSLSPAGDASDPHLIAVLDDVTELKALEAQFVQSQKMQALGQLAGGVAHDFNNLLTAIAGHCDLLLLRHDAADPDYPDLIQVRQNVNRAAALVGQLLAFSRKQSMMPETLDLRVVLSELAHLLNRLVGERVRLVLDHNPDLRFIRADKRQLEQVIMNLVVNARDAMPEGGRIRIETENLRLDQPTVQGRATVPAGAYVRVKVTDEGTGIPPERLPKIFDPFYTTKKPGEGTGLGLSTVYGIIKQSGAYVFVDSEVGRGTTFTLWFPAHDKGPEAAPAPPAASSAPAQPSPGVILLAEDEAPVRAFAARALRMRGHTVIEADCAQAALACMDEAGGSVDLILTDVILPDLDGPTWVREALGRCPGPRVIFVSGYAESAFGEHKAAIEGSVFLPKPFSLSELTAEVERQLAKRARPAGPFEALVAQAGE